MCTGVVHDVCNYTCAAGTQQQGAHVCSVDGVWRGGWCYGWSGTVARSSFEDAPLGARVALVQGQTGLYRVTPPRSLVSLTRF